MSDWLFGPDSMMWRINREAVLLLGGRAALLMQLAHPLVAAGVAEHSDFPRDAVPRLRRTLDTMLAIVFGTEESAREVAGRVNSIHRSVRGISVDGRSYSARDPHLMLWVHATLVDSSIRVYEACVEPLTEEETDRYYDETLVVGRLFGIPDEVLPDSLPALRDWMRSMIDSDEVQVTPLARELGAAVLRPVSFIPLRLAETSAFITASLLPPPLREGYGLSIGKPSSALLALGRTASRKVLPLVPRALRTFPAARRPEIGSAGDAG